MKEPKQLYFLALIPDPGLREEIRQLKLEMRERFGASHALKSPAHITLQMPFRRPESIEEVLFKSLEHFASDRESFQVGLDGFDCFEPRVLFVRVVDHKPLISLQERLKIVLQKEIGLLDKELTMNIHPHLTIATRDLSPTAFYKAWPEFEGRVLRRSFLVHALYLLKHNGKYWDVFRKFSFGKVGSK